MFILCVHSSCSRIFLFINLILVVIATVITSQLHESDFDDDDSTGISRNEEGSKLSSDSNDFVEPTNIITFKTEDAIPNPQDHSQSSNSDESISFSKEMYETAKRSLFGRGGGRLERTEAWQLMNRASELGNIDARVELAWAILAGNHVKQDIAVSRSMFEEAANIHGHSNAQIGLAFLYGSGISFNSSQARALLYYTFAAFGGSPWAQMAIGYRYWAGVGVASNCEKALDYYRQVAKTVTDGVSFAGSALVVRTRLIDELEAGTSGAGTSDTDFVDYLHLSADKGNIEALMSLGQLHFHGGKGVEVNHQLAKHFFMLAAEAGSAIGWAWMGKLLMEGSDVIPQDLATAFLYFSRAAEKRDSVGQCGLGLMYLKGLGVERNEDKAFALFTMASEQNSIEAQYQLGYMYLMGLSVTKDLKVAVKHFNLAAQSGHLLAFYQLAELHSNGVGVIRSCQTAVELYKNVAERGRWSRNLMEAHADYRAGLIDQALVKYLILAELGYEVAQSNAAYILDRGESDIWRDSASNDSWRRALVYYTRAANQGYSAARVRLGDYYYYGLGVPVDYESAAFHYNLAAEHMRNPQAMFNLGLMHESGLGMRRDMHLAKRYFDMAAETSPDALVPVALALIKLGGFVFFENCLDMISSVFEDEIWLFFFDSWETIMFSLCIILLVKILKIRQHRANLPPL